MPTQQCITMNISYELGARMTLLKERASTNTPYQPATTRATILSSLLGPAVTNCCTLRTAVGRFDLSIFATESSSN